MSYTGRLQKTREVCIMMGWRSFEVTKLALLYSKICWGYVLIKPMLCPFQVSPGIYIRLVCIGAKGDWVYIRKAPWICHNESFSMLGCCPTKFK